MQNVVSPESVRGAPTPLLLGLYVYGDLTTIEREVRSGRAVLLPAGTQVEVIGSAGFLKTRVRVKSGPYAGQEGVMDAGAVLP